MLVISAAPKFNRTWPRACAHKRGVSWGTQTRANARVDERALVFVRLGPGQTVSRNLKRAGPRGLKVVRKDAPSNCLTSEASVVTLGLTRAQVTARLLTGVSSTVKSEQRTGNDALPHRRRQSLL